MTMVRLIYQLGFSGSEIQGLETTEACQLTAPLAPVSVLSGGPKCRMFWIPKSSAKPIALLSMKRQRRFLHTKSYPANREECIREA